jgi:transposase-like protein
MLNNFNNLIEFQKAFSTELKCIKYLEKLRWDNKPCCFRCKRNDKTYFTAKAGLYACGHCRSQFSIRKGTIFEDSPLKLVKWFLAFYLEISNSKGISSCQLGKDIGTRQATAWFLLQRIRWALQHKTIEKMDGDIEIDETYVGGKEANKHKDRKTFLSQGGNNKMVVLGVLQRKGRLALELIKKSNIKNIKPILDKQINFSNTQLYTDESPLYKGYDREVVNHSKKEYSRGNASTNSIEGAFGLFKRRIYGIHHQISKKHIDKYINSFCFHFNNKAFKIAKKFDNAMEMMFGKRLSYEELVGKEVVYRF